jgi:hypothetical protein
MKSLQNIKKEWKREMKCYRRWSLNARLIELLVRITTGAFKTMDNRCADKRNVTLVLISLPSDKFKTIIQTILSGLWSGSSPPENHRV